MAQIQIPCLVSRTNKAGITSWYWQPSAALAKAGWKAIPLGKSQSAAIDAAQKRNEEIDAWRAGGAAPRDVKKREKAGTFGALLQAYEKNVIDGLDPATKKRRIAASTARTYRTSLRRLRAWAGDFPMAYITKARVKTLRNALLHPTNGVGHHAAHQCLKLGRQVFAYAESEDMIAPGANPFLNFGLAAPPPREVIWSPDAREAMILAAYECGKPSMALAIMLGFATGQREADLLGLVHRSYVALPQHKMQPEDYRTLAGLASDGVPRGLRVRQNKTKAWVEIPVVGLVRWALEANIADARTRGTTMVLLDDTRHDPEAGQPPATYTDKAGQTRFQRDFAEVREWAAVYALGDGAEELAEELATLQFSDLRRTCVVYLGELGLDAHLIAGVTGHDIDETQRILKTYMPRTTGRAARAIALASVRQAQETEAKEQRHG